jgi:tetratricopeptide (TPR) repeat protein
MYGDCMMIKCLFFICFTLLMPYLAFCAGVQEAFQVFEDPNTGLTIFPTLLIPLGGQYEGMGTAFTAMATDSGFIESNPAGSSMLERNELSFHHHSWIDDSSLEGVIYTSRINNFGFGVCGKFLFIPFDRIGSWGQLESRGIISETIGIVNVSYNFFKNYYYSGLALGLNIKGAYRDVPEVLYTDKGVDTQSIAAGMIDAGLLTRFNFLKFYASRSRNFSVGLAVKNIGIKTGEDPLPTLFSSGIAYSFIKPVTITLDFNLPFSFDQVNYPAERWYFATGTNIVITDFISMQAGFRLKENPHISLGSTLEMKQFSIVANYNLDLSGSFNPLDKFSIEAKIKLGHEDEMERRKKVDSLFARGLEAYANGDYLLALEYWEEALELDPQFTLAREYIETTRKYLELQDEMEEKQENIKEEK